MDTLKFGKGNSKLGKETFTFSLPAGFTCPGASECLAFAHPDYGTIKDGPEQRFRCFSASTENLYASVRESRHRNLRLLQLNREHKAMVQLIMDSLPKEAKKVRIHVSGDFYSQSYFDAWLAVAQQRFDIVFYAYTKSIPYWAKQLTCLPENLVLTASMGGKFDDLATNLGLPYAKVVFSPEEAAEEGLQIDHDDSLASQIHPRVNIALLLHGKQPAGSSASKAQSAMTKRGIAFSYKFNKKTASKTP